MAFCDFSRPGPSQFGSNLLTQIYRLWPPIKGSYRHQCYQTYYRYRRTSVVSTTCVIQETGIFFLGSRSDSCRSFVFLISFIQFPVLCTSFRLVCAFRCLMIVAGCRLRRSRSTQIPTGPMSRAGRMSALAWQQLRP